MLLPFYAGEVKCIYVDPPYNTDEAFNHFDDNHLHNGHKKVWANKL